MLDDRTITQAKFGTTLTHGFLADEMRYTLRDYGGEVQFSVDYDALDILAQYTVIIADKLFARRLLVVIAAAGGAISFLLLEFSNFHNATTITLIATGSLCLLLSLAQFLNYFGVKYTMVPMSPAPLGAGKRHIRVMCDKNHASVLDEMKTRWKARIKERHGNIDFSNDPEKEIAKFTWLKKHSIVTDDEFRTAVEKLRAGSANDPLELARARLN